MPSNRVSGAFNALAASYNFRKHTNRRRVFVDVVLDRAHVVSGSAARVVDIGCGRGVGRGIEYLQAIKDGVGEVWGLDPDPTGTETSSILDHYQCATMEAADLPSEYFDVAYSYMVMEHVDDPAAFLKAVHRALRPGGEYVFVTPNLRHYFTRIALLLHRAGLDELVLRLVRRRQVDYHYPVRYACNDIATIERLSASAGFHAPRVAYLETRGPRGYLPGILRPIYWLGSLTRRVFQRPDRLLSMIVVLRKPG